MRDGRRLRRPQREGRARARHQIEPLGARAFARHRPQRVGEVLLDQRDLGLHGDADVRQRLAAAAVGRDPGQDPGGPLLVHEAARAVDRIDERDDLRGALRRPLRQHAAPVRAQALGDQQTRPAGGEGGEAIDQHPFRHAIHRIDDVARLLAGHRRQLVGRRARARRDDFGADGLVNRLDGLDQRGLVTHAISVTEPAGSDGIATMPQASCGIRRRARS